MELINNRYRVIKNLKQSRLSSSYFVADMMRDHREIELNILNSEYIPDLLIEFFSTEFMILKQFL